jgi:hypothetical protein
MGRPQKEEEQKQAIYRIARRVLRKFICPKGHRKSIKRKEV